VHTVIDAAVCALDGPAEQFDVAPDSTPLAQIVPILFYM
jgi:hypothetical protein